MCSLFSSYIAPRHLRLDMPKTFSEQQPGCEENVRFGWENQCSVALAAENRPGYIIVAADTPTYLHNSSIARGYKNSWLDFFHRPENKSGSVLFFL